MHYQELSFHNYESLTTYSLCPQKNVILEILGQIIKEVK
jgi:hypothetical protein